MLETIPNQPAAISKPKAAEKVTPSNGYPMWAPRFWHGMLFTDWMRLLARHNFRVHPLRWVLGAGITFTSTFNSKMRIAQQALMGHRISKTAVPDDPIFILGHWRSGTTYLHELLSVDERFASPTTYQCFAANHFLLTEAVVTRLLWFLIPSKRPMDNVAAGWHEPQEDEFALCSMGVNSPYLRMAFPNEDEEHLNYLDMQSLSDDELYAWQTSLYDFLRCLAFHHDNKRIVLKSPTHTGRLRLLSEMFPSAKFVHIVRNPYDVVPSTLRLWKSLDHVQGLQVPKRDMESYVHRAYERMYGGFHKVRNEIPADRIIDIHYEDLTADGCGVLENVYEHLQLGEFHRVRSQLEQTLERKKNYRKNEHSLSPSLVASINRNWRDYFERYNYEILTGQ